MNAADPVFHEPTDTGTRPEMLIAAVLHLMSQYTSNRDDSGDNGACVRLAAVIERHLKMLSELPEIAPVLQATCLQLSEQWEQMIDRMIAPPPKGGLLVRLMLGKREGL